jgi:hypothetical protein
MTSGFFSVKALEESELDRAVAILDEGFADTFESLVGAVPLGKPEGKRVRERYYRRHTPSVGLHGEDGTLEGVCLLSAMGTRGGAGPLAIRPAFDTRVAARALMTSVALGGMKLGCTSIESVTFPQSPSHLVMHFSFCEPLYPAPFVTKSVQSGTAQAIRVRGPELGDWVRFSSFTAAEREVVKRAAQKVTGKFTPGFDLSDDLDYVVDRKIGDAFVLRQADDVLGLAVCHYGDRSEAFQDHQLLVKHLYIDPDTQTTLQNPQASPLSVFGQVLRHVEGIAKEQGLEEVGMMASSGRRTMLRHLLDWGYGVSEVHQHWAGKSPVAGQPVRSAGNDLASIQTEQFGTTELR